MNAEDLLNSIASQSDEHEFHTPIPEGYTPGQTKYVIVFGTVMSGLGKGIFSSSLAKLIQDQGYTVAPVKFDGYLNQDAGTLNPYRHGEVFVLDDGLECDMDLGTYERFLNQTLDKDNYMTGGKLFRQVLSKERKGGFLGRDVQFIPHVTGRIKEFMRELALKRTADIVFIEVGGTVGDIENMYFIEAMRELGFEEGKGNVCYVSLTFLMEPKFLGEQKSKAAQLGIRNLLSLGIQPDIIACRSQNPLSEKVREKISLYSNVAMKRVVGVHDVTSIYEIPLLLREREIDVEVLKILGLENKENTTKITDWEHYVSKITHAKNKLTIGITGKYTGLRDSYASVIKALEHAATHFDSSVEIQWIDTTLIEEEKISVGDALKGVDGIIVPGGFGKRGTEGKIECIRYVRENNIPYLGLCYGFQMALIEFARNVCGLRDANSSEIETDAKHLVVDILPEQKDIKSLGGNMRLGGHEIEIKQGTKAEALYGALSARERFRHRFECNPSYIETFEKHGLVFSGRAPKQPIMQILELPNHPYFVGTQCHPEFTSRPLSPNPLYRGFVEAALKR